MDETEYLLNSEENKERLMSSIEQLKTDELKESFLFRLSEQVTNGEITRYVNGVEIGFAGMHMFQELDPYGYPLMYVVDLNSNNMSIFRIAGESEIFDITEEEMVELNKLIVTQQQLCLEDNTYGELGEDE